MARLCLFVVIAFCWAFAEGRSTALSLKSYPPIINAIILGLNEDVAQKKMSEISYPTFSKSFLLGKVIVDNLSVKNFSTVVLRGSDDQQIFKQIDYPDYTQFYLQMDVGLEDFDLEFDIVTEYLLFFTHGAHGKLINNKLQVEVAGSIYSYNNFTCKASLTNVAVKDIGDFQFTSSGGNIVKLLINVVLQYIVPYFKGLVNVVISHLITNEKVVAAFQKNACAPFNF